MKMIDKETSESLNQFGVQPFKDSLKLDFAATAATYLAQKQKKNIWIIQEKKYFLLRIMS